MRNYVFSIALLLVLISASVCADYRSNSAQQGQDEASRPIANASVRAAVPPPAASAPVPPLAAEAVRPPEVRLAQYPPPQEQPASAPRRLGRALYEPDHGVYLGAALDFSNLTGSGSGRDQMRAIMRDWETQSGRKQAFYVQFIPFPDESGQFVQWDTDSRGWATAADFCNAATDSGAVPLLTLEPQKPFMLLDWEPGSDAYEATKSFAQGIGGWNKPVFIRFAHEMNGSWYPWAEWNDKNNNLKRDPGEDTGFTAADYCTAYRNVASMFRRYAPKAALVWCPNNGLLGGPHVDPYVRWYPGDDVVDWVGLDFYEKGFEYPLPGAHLWGGQFAYNMTHDDNDDPATPTDESINFYKTYAQDKHKPLMLCETSATLSYRTDLSVDDRALLNHQWKMGYWDKAEYGWMQGTYGTTAYNRQPLLSPIDRDFPWLKAIGWFQIAKHEWIPAVSTENGQQQLHWFNDTYTDYRIGGGVAEGGDRPYAEQELNLYRALTDNSYFLTSVQK